jgi:hypothetical protein
MASRRPTPSVPGASPSRSEQKGGSVRLHQPSSSPGRNAAPMERGPPSARRPETAPRTSTVARSEAIATTSTEGASLGALQALGCAFSRFTAAPGRSDSLSTHDPPRPPRGLVPRRSEQVAGSVQLHQPSSRPGKNAAPTPWSAQGQLAGSMNTLRSIPGTTDPLAGLRVPPRGEHRRALRGYSDNLDEVCVSAISKSSDPRSRDSPPFQVVAIASRRATPLAPWAPPSRAEQVAGSVRLHQPSSRPGMNTAPTPLERARADGGPRSDR